MLRSTILYSLVHGMAVLVASGPLPGVSVDCCCAAQTKQSSDSHSSESVPVLVDTESPEPGPLLHKPSESSVVGAWVLIAKYVSLPANVRRHSGRAPHALLATETLYPATLQSVSVRLQI